jgi:hypothetical protein
MLPIFKEIIHNLPSNLPQCYETANIVYDKMVEVSKSMKPNPLFNEVKNPTMSALYELNQSLSVIEINIKINKISGSVDNIRKQYNIKNKFWIPRIFNHSFNILILENMVIISQSWFKVSDYKIIHSFTFAEFIIWLDDFTNALKDYGTNPKALFDLFKYFVLKENDTDVLNLFKYIKKNKNNFTIDLCIKTIKVQ